MRLRQLMKQFKHVPLDRKERYEYEYDLKRKKARELGLEAIKPLHRSKGGIEPWRVKELMKLYDESKLHIMFAQ